MVQHGGLSAERWATFTLDQQILMIGNEMNRAGQMMGPSDRGRLRSSYERVLQLTDLTVRVNDRRALRRELLRWRDLVARLYVGPDADPGAHREAFRCLLRFTPLASKQIPLLFRDDSAPSAP